MQKIYVFMMLLCCACPWSIYGMKSYLPKHDQAGIKRLISLAHEEDPDSQSFMTSLHIPNDAHILSMGCGAATMEFWMAKYIVPRGLVHATDVSEEYVEAAVDRAINDDIHNISCTKMNVYDIPEFPKYDVVYARYLLEHLSEPKKALLRMCSALKNKGILILEDEDFYATRVGPNINSANEDVMQLAKYIADIKGVDYGIGPKISSLIPGEPHMSVIRKIQEQRSSGAKGIILFCDTVQEVCEKSIEEKVLNPNRVSCVLKWLSELRNQVSSYPIDARGPFYVHSTQYKLCARRMDIL